jgi:ankyrin repeat protein
MSKYQELQEELQNLRGLLIDGLGQNNEALKQEAVKKFSQFSKEEQVDFLSFIRSSIITVNTNEDLPNYPLKNVLALSIIDCANDVISTEKQREYLTLLLDAEEIDQELLPGLNTPLERAALRGNLPMVRLLIEKQKAQPEYIFSFLMGLISRNFSVLSSDRDLKEKDLKKVMSNSECYNYILQQINLFSLEDAEDAATILIELNKVIKETIETKREWQSKASVEQLIGDLERSQDYIESQLFNNSPKVSKICGAIVDSSECIRPYNKLHIAILLGDRDRYKKYIESNPGLIEPSKYYKKTPLMYACEVGHVGIAEDLIENGANVNSLDSDGKMAIVYASKNGWLDLVKLLVKNGAKLDFIEEDTTPLMCASEAGHIEIVEYLVKVKAKINAIDSKGRSALMYAVGNIEIVRYLVENGAYVDTVDREGNTALVYAFKAEHFKTVECLVENDPELKAVAEGQTISMRGWIKEDLELITYLLKIGKITHESCSKTLLYLDKYQENSEATRILRQYLKKVRTESSQNFTPDYSPRVQSTGEKSSYK